MPQSVISEQATQIPETLTKQGILGQNKEKQNNDKSTIRMPRHSSFMIMHTFAEWGNTGQNKADGKSDTTDLTTKGARLAV